MKIDGVRISALIAAFFSGLMVVIAASGVQPAFDLGLLSGIGAILLVVVAVFNGALFVSIAIRGFSDD